MAIIKTTKGDLDESVLDKREGSMEDQDKKLDWIEYWYNNELVHRSVNMALKRGIDIGMDAAAI